MKILTSYYGSRLLDRAHHYLVRISNSAPKGFAFDETLGGGIPNWLHIIKPYKEGTIDKDVYRRRYREQLKDLSFTIRLSLERIIQKAREQDKDVVLLCYEKPGDFCHRHILAGWLENNPEFKDVLGETGTPEIRELGTEQKSLF